MSISNSLSRRPWGYDAGMELLCSIPIGAPQPIRQLAKDHGLTVRQVKRQIRRLVDELGYGITAVDGGAVVSHKGRDRVTADAEAYWLRVYERQRKRAACR